MSDTSSDEELCRECVDAISPHWNRCAEGTCIVADTFDAAAQARETNPHVAALDAMAALSEGEHGYNAHVSAHRAQMPAYLSVTVVEGPEADREAQRIMDAQRASLDAERERLGITAAGDAPSESDRSLRLDL